MSASSPTSSSSSSSLSTAVSLPTSASAVLLAPQTPPTSPGRLSTPTKIQSTSVAVSAQQDTQSGRIARGPISKSGLSISCGHYAMRGIRPEMEDQAQLLPHPMYMEEVNHALFNGKKELKDDQIHRSLFAVYDGHAGTVCAKYCKQNVHLNLYREESMHPGPLIEEKKDKESGGGKKEEGGKKEDPIAVCLQNALLATDRAFSKGCRELNLLASSGSTAIVAYIVQSILYVANVGDSRGVLCRAGKAVALSNDHKPGRTDEKKRVEKLGGKVGITEDDAFGRIKCAWICVCFRRLMDPQKPLRIFPGGLSVSRTIGDISLKATGLIIPDPEMTRHPLDLLDEFVILACDGVWDVLSNQQAVNSVRNEIESGGDEETAARALAERAFSNGSSDNISVVVIAFHWKNQADQKKPKPSKHRNSRDNYQSSRPASGSTGSRGPATPRDPASASPSSVKKEEKAEEKYHNVNGVQPTGARSSGHNPQNSSPPSNSSSRSQSFASDPQQPTKGRISVVTSSTTSGISTSSNAPLGGNGSSGSGGGTRETGTPSISATTVTPSLTSVLQPPTPTGKDDIKLDPVIDVPRDSDDISLEKHPVVKVYQNTQDIELEDLSRSGVLTSLLASSPASSSSSSSSLADSSSFSSFVADSSASSFSSSAASSSSLLSSSLVSSSSISDLRAPEPSKPTSFPSQSSPSAESSSGSIPLLSTGALPMSSSSDQPSPTGTSSEFPLSSSSDSLLNKNPSHDNNPPTPNHPSDPMDSTPPTLTPTTLITTEALVTSDEVASSSDSP